MHLLLLVHWSSARGRPLKSTNTVGADADESTRGCPVSVTQRPGNDFEVGGGGGGVKRLSGSKVTPTKNLKLLGFCPLFFGRDPNPSSRAKTNKNKNERHRQSKVGGAAPPPVQNLEGQAPSLPPPPPPPVPGPMPLQQHAVSSGRGPKHRIRNSHYDDTNSAPLGKHPVINLGWW